MCLLWWDKICLHFTNVFFFLIFHCKVTSFYTLWALFIYCCNIYTNAPKITSKNSFWYLHKTRLLQDSIIFNFPHLYTKVTMYVLKLPPILGNFWLISFWLWELKLTRKTLPATWHTLVVLQINSFFLSSQRSFWYSYSSLTNRCTFIKTLINLHKIRWLLHVSVYDHRQGACNWAWLKLYWY